MTFKNIHVGTSLGKYNGVSYNIHDNNPYGHIYICIEKDGDLASFVHFDINYHKIGITKINRKAWNSTYMDGTIRKHNYNYYKLEETKINVTTHMAIDHLFKNCNGWSWGNMFSDAIL
jgi:hypothetical protein